MRVFLLTFLPTCLFRGAKKCLTGGPGYISEGHPSRTSYFKVISTYSFATRYFKGGFRGVRVISRRAEEGSKNYEKLKLGWVETVKKKV